MRRFPQQYLRRHSLSQDPCHDTHYTASLKGLYRWALEGLEDSGVNGSESFTRKTALDFLLSSAYSEERTGPAIYEGVDGSRRRFMAVPYVNSQAATAAAARRPAP
ncbi:hypothetical protein J6590_069067 [Homalodisca vitripennis]|nr:hypothetical protein J6590_069067 [Homalodisca vitripennis]